MVYEIPLLTHLMQTATYLDIVKGEPVSEKVKNVRLWQIFEKFTLELKSSLNTENINQIDLDECLNDLKSLKISSENRYNKFNLKIKKFKLNFTQNVFSILPNIISKYILKIYPFNRMHEYVLNVELVRKEYANLNQFIDKKINDFEILNKKKSEEIKNEIEKLKPLHDEIQIFLHLTQNETYEFKKFTNNLREFCFKIEALDHSRDIRKLMIDAGFNELLITKIISNLSKIFIVELLKPDQTNALKNFISELAGEDFVNRLFASFDEVINFNIDSRKIMQLIKNQARQRETCLNDYKGVINIRVRTPHDFETIREFKKILEENKTCRPCRLVISTEKNFSLTPLLVDELSALSTLVPHILLEGPDLLDLGQYSLEQQEGLKQFFTFADRINSNQEKLIFPTNIGDWDDRQILELAIFFQGSELDLSSVPCDQLNRILGFFPKISHLTFNQPDLTDTQFLYLFNLGHFTHLKRLDLEGCENLSTDIISELVEIKSLTEFNAANLKRGKASLIPLSDPFQVKHFYASVKSIAELAGSLYNGSLSLASVFQIPVARQTDKLVFSDNQIYLDPRSVSHWLYKNDYLHLGPQQSVKSIFADETPYLNDDNICAFLQKFPQVEELSLYGCPNITIKGVISLLERNPQLKKLDLTNCYGLPINQITDALKIQPLLLQGLKEIIVSGNKHQNEIDLLPVELLKKIKITQTILKITDEQLKEVKSLKAALESYLPLNKIAYLDLSGCKSLNIQDFHYLVDSLNLDIQTNSSGYLFLNPNKLNITVLDLNDSGFNPLWLTINDKGLNRLNQIILGRPKNSRGVPYRLDALKSQYPLIQFTEKFSPLEKLPIDQISTRILLELFQEKVINEEVTNVDNFLPLAEFSDDSGINFTLPQEELYCLSPLIRDQLRQGGEFYKSTVSQQNQNFTSGAGNILSNLMSNHHISEDASLINLIEAAEIVNAKALDIPVFYETIMSSVYTKIVEMPLENFVNDLAFDVMTKLIALQDRKAMVLFEHTASLMVINNSYLATEFIQLAPNLLHFNKLLRLILQRELISEDQAFNAEKSVVDPATLEIYKNLFDTVPAEEVINRLFELPPALQNSLIDALLNYRIESLERFILECA